jgi:hypothetical protein
MGERDPAVESLVINSDSCRRGTVSGWYLPPRWLGAEVFGFAVAPQNIAPENREAFQSQDSNTTLPLWRAISIFSAPSLESFSPNSHDCRPSSGDTSTVWPMPPATRRTIIGESHMARLTFGLTVARPFLDLASRGRGRHARCVTGIDQVIKAGLATPHQDYLRSATTFRTDG